MTEWREAEREKAAARQEWGKRVALALTVPLLAGGCWAFPVVYAWVFLCRRWPRLRPWGMLLALPALAGAGLRTDAVLGPSWALLTLPLHTGAVERTVAFAYPWASVRVVRPPGAVPGQIAVAGLDVVRSWEPGTGPDPLPLLRDVALTSWPTGLVLAAGLCAAWGAAGLLEGRRLQSRTPGHIRRNARRAEAKGGGTLDVLQGVLLRGYITLLFGPSGGGKTELVLAVIAASLRAAEPFCGRALKRAKWYYAMEQADENFAPYLEAWGLDDAVAKGRLKIVTRSEISAVWHAHGHEAVPDWMDVAPLLLEDAGRWGADVFVLDTLLDWSGAPDNATLRKHMGPIRAAVSTHGYAFLAVGHTNQQGGLLGATAFWKLCEVVLRLEMPWGKYDPRRVLHFEKDRARGTVPQLAVRRDMDADPPTYRLVGADDGEAAAEVPANVVDMASRRKGVGVRSLGEKKNERTKARAKRDPDEATLNTVLRRRGPISTVALAEATGWDANKTHRVLAKLRERGAVERAGKDGRAAVWQLASGGAQEARG